MGRKTRKRPPPRPQFGWHLAPKPEAYDCLVCYREKEVVVKLMEDQVAEIRCSSCHTCFAVELAGACTNELDAYHVWVDRMEDDELSQARARMTTAAVRGLDISCLSEQSFLSSTARNRRV